MLFALCDPGLSQFPFSAMAKFTTIFTTVLLLIAGGQASSDVVKCPENKYYDHGVENCEPCTDICQNALYKKTVEDCRELCPAGKSVGPQILYSVVSESVQ